MWPINFWNEWVEFISNLRANWDYSFFYFYFKLQTKIHYNECSKLILPFINPCRCIIDIKVFVGHHPICYSLQRNWYRYQNIDTNRGDSDALYRQKIIWFTNICSLLLRAFIVPKLWIIWYTTRCHCSIFRNVKNVRKT